MEDSRKCSRCGAARPISEYRAKQYGRYLSYCKTCQTPEHRAEYEKVLKERNAARLAKWDLEHPGRANERSRRHKEKNRDKVNARRRELHAANPEQRNSVKRAWRELNYEEENRKARESMQRWRDRDGNKEKARLISHMHRVRKTGNSSEHVTEACVLEILKLQKGRCAYCRKDIREYYEIDHIDPISKGGCNHRRNLQLTCQSCNRRKKDKDPLVYARLLGRLL